MVRADKGKAEKTMITTYGNEAEQAVRRCRDAQAVWQTLSVRERLRPVRAVRQRLVDACERICAAAGADVGKSPAEALASEVLPLAEACRFLERHAVSLLRPRRVAARTRPLFLWGQRDVVHRRPRGVVGIIGTWNYPFLLNGVQIVQALTAGNGVVWKPSEVAPQSAAVLAGLLTEFPPDLVQTLPATREMGGALADADVDHVVFTGSEAVGRKLAAHLGGRLVSSTLELSGCDALFVLDDADIPLAAKAAWWAVTVNRGQTCIAARRVFVQRSRSDAFLDALRPMVEQTAPMRLALAGQVQQADRLVEAALAEKGRLLAGPMPGGVDGQTCALRVVADARPEWAICQEASFAPLLAVLPFDSDRDALAMQQYCPFGLAASLFTGDVRRAQELASRLHVGMVAINDAIAPTAHPATPFGGRGASGWGVTQGVEGLLEMTVPQTVSVRPGKWRPHYDPPGSTAMTRYETLRALLQFGHGRTWRQRWGALWGLWRAVRGA
jgi:acyl-CoA reductase-like NAD-dependent aldehyde dehydrogenase